MLESFREVGEEHLDADASHRLRDRHAAYYLAHPAPPDRALSAPEQTARHLAIEAEFDNYVAAIEHSLAHGRLEAAIRLLETLRTTWTSRGPREVERRLIRTIAERVEREAPQIDPAAHIGLLRMLGTVHIRVSEYAAAYAVCERAIEVARRADVPDGVAVALSALSTCAGFLGRLDECLALNERVLALASEENLVLRERAYLGIGAVHWGRGDLESAERAYERAATVSVRLHGGEIDTHLLANLARVAMDAGRHDESMTRLGEAMRLSRRVHDEFGLAEALSLVSRYHWLKGQIEAARSTGREALLRARACDFHHFSLAALSQQALILVDAGELVAAATLLAATSGLDRVARTIDARDADAARTTLRARLAPAAYERAWAKGLTMNTDEAFRLALSLES
ncbi:tetratricopeptide repeat protein [bacterium]|nr:MAG: tetratricopeptide repeat protein [bacterium]